MEENKMFSSFRLRCKRMKKKGFKNVLTKREKQIIQERRNHDKVILESQKETATMAAKLTE